MTQQSHCVSTHAHIQNKVWFFFFGSMLAEEDDPDQGQSDMAVTSNCMLTFAFSTYKGRVITYHISHARYIIYCVE